jgi:hypothetical protein
MFYYERHSFHVKKIPVRQTPNRKSLIIPPCNLHTLQVFHLTPAAASLFCPIS